MPILHLDTNLSELKTPIVLSKQIHRVDINVCHRVSTSLQQLMWSRSNRYNR